jgi:phosphoribosylformimino-5-aminoimidazole carboxamide ribotide isomerase
MIILPAIDLFSRKAVRMEMGRENNIVFEMDDPYTLSIYWYKKGAKGLHLIDLQSAIRDEESNIDIIEKIIKDVPIPIEVGGGIRSIEKIERILSLGAWRVIISSLLKRDANFLKELRERYGKRIIPSIDWNDKFISIKGWKEFIPWEEVRYKLEFAGFDEIIFTDISRDGTLKGINDELICFLLENTNFDIWIAGGISSIDDVLKIKKINERYLNRIKGIIVGRALLEGKVSLEEMEEIICLQKE